ncbi:MAG: SpoIVB peptidase [Bacillota bacterium]
MSWNRPLAGWVLAAAIVGLVNTPQFKSYARLPSHIELPAGQAQELQLNLPFGLTVEADSGGVIGLNGRPIGRDVTQVPRGESIVLDGVQPGAANLELRLFGWVPIKRVSVAVVPEKRVIPGGHSIGVRLRSEGVMVVGYSVVADGHPPGREAGIQPGDVLLSINGRALTSEAQTGQVINEEAAAGRPLQVRVKRDGGVFTRTLTAVQDNRTGRYVIGLYVRDGAAGVGTLTFYDPQSHKFGALGHVITDQDTGKAIDVREGQIVKATITGIQRGERGQAGEKIGVFTEDGPPWGLIEKNTEFGITGEAENVPRNPLFPSPIAVGLLYQVHEGPAKILTVLDGTNIEAFDIEIQRVIRQTTPDSKSMILRVTDQRLLSKTGGIVQGMSGSPIIQDGRLVGAVTHVFVNDPTRGYGVFIEWMLEESGAMAPQQSLVGAGDLPGALEFGHFSLC